MKRRKTVTVQVLDGGRVLYATKSAAPGLLKLRAQMEALGAGSPTLKFQISDMLNAMLPEATPIH